MPTPKKAETIAEIQEALSTAQLTVVADYRGLKVADLQTFRTKLRAVKGQARVAKNTLTKRAAEETGKQGLGPFLEGPTLLITTADEPVAVAKEVGDFVRTSRILKVKGGLAGQRVINEADLAAIAILPGREVLLGRVVGQIQAPLAGLVNVLNGPMRKIVYALQARVDQLNAASSASSEAAPAAE